MTVGQPSPEPILLLSQLTLCSVCTTGSSRSFPKEGFLPQSALREMLVGEPRKAGALGSNGSGAVRDFPRRLRSVPKPAPPQPGCLQRPPRFGPCRWPVRGPLASPPGPPPYWPPRVPWSLCVSTPCPLPTLSMSRVRFVKSTLKPHTLGPAFSQRSEIPFLLLCIFKSEVSFAYRKRHEL